MTWPALRRVWGRARSLLWDRTRGARGSITPFVLIVSVGFLALSALVIDGGRQMNSKGRAVAYAQEAARAGAQVIDVNDERLPVVPRLAIRAADRYCDEARSHDPRLVRCSADTEDGMDENGRRYWVVTVRTQIDIDAILLGMFHKPTLTSTGAAAARPVSGTSEADASQVETQPPPSNIDVLTPGGPGDITTEPSGSTASTGPVEVPSCVTSPPTTPTEGESSSPPTSPRDDDESQPDPDESSSPTPTVDPSLICVSTTPPAS